MFRIRHWIVTVGLLASLPIGFSLSAFHAGSPNLSVPAIQHEHQIYDRLIPLPTGTFHAVIIPPGSSYRVMPASSDRLQDVAGFAKQVSSPLVLNGGYFDPKNGKTTSFMTLGGKLVGDPRQNERLMENPDLKPYLEKILNRSEFRVYQCPEGIRYDIALHNAAIPSQCQLSDALGAGPLLAPENQAVLEGFAAYQDGKLTRDPLGINHLNARTAVGLTKTGAVILGMLAQKPSDPSHSGVTLEQLCSLMHSLGAVKVMALDGGSSSSLFVEGKATYGKVDAKGQPVRRNVKTFLVLQGKPE